MSGSSPDLIVHFVAVGIANACVGIGWLVVLVLAVFGIRRWRDAVLARGTGEEEQLGGLKWLAYVLAITFWPAAVVLGLLFLRKRATARAGAVCFYLLLAYISFCVVVAIALVTGAAVLYPEWFTGF